MEREGREKSADKSPEWSCLEGEGLATEEETKSAGGGGGWQDADGDGVGTQESGAEEPVESTSAGGSKTRKATSAAADKAGAGGSHVARYGLRERVAGRRENPASESSGVGVQEGGREAYGVAGKPSKVGGKEGGREAYGVAENPGGEPRESSRRCRVAAGHRHPRSGQVSPGG